MPKWFESNLTDGLTASFKMSIAFPHYFVQKHLRLSFGLV